MNYILLTEELIQKTFPNSFEKGVEYYHNDMVGDWNVSMNKTSNFDKHLKMQSEVLGSNNQTYTQEIALIEHFGQLQIYGHCSCYVGLECKHIVAVLIEYIDNSDEIKEETEEERDQRLKREKIKEVNNWVDNISNKSTYSEDMDSFSYIEKPKAQVDFKIVYQLAKYNNKYGVNILKRRVLKRGGLGKPSDVNLYYLHRKNSFEQSFLSLEDEEILSFLKISDSSYSSNNFLKIDGRLGFTALKRLLNKDNFVFDDLDTPITNGESKLLKIDWLEVENDNAFQLSVIFDDDSEIFSINPPLYFNSKSLKIGKIENFNLSETEYKHMISEAPIIHKDIIKDVSKKILKDIPTIPPLLSKEETHIKIDSKPKPYLILDKTHFDNLPEDSRTECIKFNFIYEKHTVNSFNKNMTISKKSSSKVVTIFRDMKQEQEYIKQITDLGFAEMQELFISPASPDLASSIERWRIFKDEVIPVLKKAGWKIKILSEFTFDFQEVENIDIEVGENNNWFEMKLSIDINGEKVSILPMVTEFLMQIEDLNNLGEMINVPFKNGTFIRISTKVMKPIIDTIIELYDGKDDSLKVETFNAHTVALLDNLDNMIYSGSNRLLELFKNLKNFKGLENISEPNGLTLSLRDYQRTGLNWLNFLREYGFNGILADDMGLGKTIQTLAFLQNENEHKRLKKPTLIVVPTSLLGNWRRESEKFTPDLRVLTLHGDKRKEHFSRVENYDLVLTTYGLVSRDFGVLSKMDFYYIILDEAQKIKNPQAKVTQNLKQLVSENRLALTGTPMENHLGELWSIFTFLMPGFLGKLDKFNKSYRKPIEKDNNEEIQKRLKKRLEPFMLRRKKDEVIKELPPKTIIIQSITFDKKQTKLYETIRVTMEKKVQEAIAQKGLASSQIMILDALLKLRQVCCDPSLLKLEAAKGVNESAKLDFLLNLVEELVAEGRKILLFSQFTSMLSIIEDRIESMNISYSKLTGSTRNRDDVIEKFKSGKADIFLISLKAGGVGLNLTEADTVIHYDPWWNPAVEEQATDRAYRIGQDKPVFVYKLVAEKTVEEKIITLQDKKRALANSMIDNKREKFELTKNDIDDLFAPIY